MVQQPALFGGIMLGAAAWLEVWAILFLASGTWQLVVIPGLFLIAGLFLGGTLQEGSQSAELAIGGICIAVAIGFVGWFWLIIDLMWGSLVSLGAGILILLGLVFIAGRASRGY